jgi:uncharacterized protein (TIGR03437 family)
MTVTATSTDSPSPTQLGRTVNVVASVKTTTARLQVALAGPLQITIPAGIAESGPSNSCSLQMPSVFESEADLSCSFILIGPTSGGTTLTATYQGDVSTTASYGAVTLATTQAQSTVTPTVSPTTPSYGQQTTLLANVYSSLTPGLTGAGVKASGTVTFASSAASDTANVSAGSASAALTGASGAVLAPAGSYSMVVTYSGDLNYAASSSTLKFTIGKACSTTVASPLTPASPGAPNLRVTVSPAACSGGAQAGGGTPTGGVQISNGTSTMSGTLSNGVAIFTVASGGYSASYSGDSNFQSSSAGIVNVTGSTLSTSVSLSVTPNPAQANQQLSLIATILGASADAAPTGRVAFSANGAAIGVATMGAAGCGSTSACLTATLPGGTQTITAAYSGDSTYAGSAASVAVIVNLLTATITASSPPAAAVYGGSVSFAVQVLPAVGGAATPAGTVQAIDNGAPTGTPTTLVNGAATIVISGLSPGTHLIGAQYSGNGNFSGATVMAGSVGVTQGQSSTTLTSAGNGNQLTLTAHVTALPPSIGAPTGSVSFVDATSGSTVGGATLSGGVATVTASFTTDPIAALYSGDSDFLSSASPAAGTVAIVNAASYAPTFSPGEIVTVFATSLGQKTLTGSAPLPTSLGGISVTVADSAGIPRQAGLFDVSPTQLSFLIPAQTAVGTATVTVSGNAGSFSSSIAVLPSAAALFTANATGQGPLAAQTVTTTSDGQTVYASTTAPNGETQVNVPIVLSSASPTYLILYGTGFDNAGSATVLLNGQSLTPAYFGPQGSFAGLDQINVLLPTSFAGVGRVNVSITVDGYISNVGTIAIQ